MTKLIKTVTVDDYVHLDDYTIDECIANLQALKERYEYKFSKLKIERQIDYDDVTKFVLTGQRLETDEEESSRLENDKRVEAHQRRQYEFLKAKFGDS